MAAAPVAGFQQVLIAPVVVVYTPEYELEVDAARDATVNKTVADGAVRDVHTPAPLARVIFFFVKIYKNISQRFSIKREKKKTLYSTRASSRTGTTCNNTT